MNGGVAEWLCSGLQSRLRRFDSDPRLQNPAYFDCQDTEIVRHKELKIRVYHTCIRIIPD